MKKQQLSVEKDREATERRLLDAVGIMIAEEGFEKTGVNAVALRSGVSKVLIYRYFGSIQGLMAAYIRRHDFWINFPVEIPERELLPPFLKQMFKRQIGQLRHNPTLRRLYRWELSCNNEMIVQLREQRERIGLDIVEKLSRQTGYPQKEMAVMASVLNASITYLVMLEDFCPVYNGIPLNSDSGWEQIEAGIEVLIDKVFHD